MAAVPVILAGDLNSDAISPGFANGPAYAVLIAAGFVDAWKVLNPADPGATWPLYGEDPPTGPSTPDRRIDLVLSTVNGIAAIGAVETGLAAPFASDHAGVVTRFELLP